MSAEAAGVAYVTMVTLGVEDVEASTRFYEHMSWERSTDSVPGVVSFLRGGSTILGLYGKAELSADAADTPLADPPAAVTLATNVGSPDVVDAFLRSAEEAGGRIVKPGQQADWGGYSGYFADPDGHLWEVAVNPSWELTQDGRALLSDDPEHPGVDARDPREELAAFRARTDEAGGRSSSDLADDVDEVMRRAAGEVAALLADAGTNKTIAVMSELTERAMQARPASRAAMAHNAGSTIVSGLLDPGDTST